MNELNELIKQHIDLKNQIDTLEKQKSFIDEQIKFFLKENGLQNYETVDGLRVTFSSVSSSRFDTKKFKESMGEEKYAEFCKESISERLTVTTPEQRELKKRFL